MRLEELKLNYHYYVTDMRYHSYSECSPQVYTKEYSNIKVSSLKLLGISIDGEYPTEGDTDAGNNVKLIHEETGIIIYTHSAFLSKVNIHNEKNNFWEWEYKYNTYNSYNSYNNNQALNSNSIAKKYDSQRRVAFNAAKEKEWKLNKLSREEKLNIIIARLSTYIDESLDKGDKESFVLYSSRLKLIKNKYGRRWNRMRITCKKYFSIKVGLYEIMFNTGKTYTIETDAYNKEYIMVAWQKFYVDTTEEKFQEYFSIEK